MCVAALPFENSGEPFNVKSWRMGRGLGSAVSWTLYGRPTHELAAAMVTSIRPIQDQASKRVNMPDVSITRTQGAFFFFKEKEGDMKVERAMFEDIWG